MDELLERGWDEIIAKRPRSALELFERYAQAHPESDEGYRGKAHAIADLGQRGEATVEELEDGAHCARKALELLPPAEDEIYKRTVIDALDLAFAWSDADRSDRAWTFLNEALGLIPQSPEIFNEIGNLAWGSYGDYPQVAELAFRRTLELCETSPSDVKGNALWGLMNIYLETQRYGKAYEVGFDLWHYVKDDQVALDDFVEMRLEELLELGRMYRFAANLEKWRKDFGLREKELDRKIEQDLLIDDIEERTLKIVIPELKRAAGRGWKTRVPPRTREIAAAKARQNNSLDDAVPEFVDLEGWGRVVTHSENWPLFKYYFGDQHQTIQRFRELRQLRNRIKHRGDLTNSEMEKLREYHQWIRGAENTWVSKRSRKRTV